MRLPLHVLAQLLAGDCFSPCSSEKMERAAERVRLSAPSCAAAELRLLSRPAGCLRPIALHSHWARGGRENCECCNRNETPTEPPHWLPHSSRADLGFRFSFGPGSADGFVRPGRACFRPGGIPEKQWHRGSQRSAEGCGGKGGDVRKEGGLPAILAPATPGRRHGSPTWGWALACVRVASAAILSRRFVVVAAVKTRLTLPSFRRHSDAAGPAVLNDGAEPPDRRLTSSPFRSLPVFLPRCLGSM